jgi:hypothetical protein
LLSPIRAADWTAGLPGLSFLFASVHEHVDRMSSLHENEARRLCRIALLGLLASASLSACAVIETIRPDGTTQRTFAFAAPVVVASGAPSPNRVTHLTGLGLTMANDAAALGWFDAQTVALDGDCRVVLIGNTEEQLQRFAAVLPKNEQICSDSQPIAGQK